MASTRLLREGLAARLATIPDLHTYPRRQGSINLPAAVVGPAPGSAISYDATMADGSHTYLFTVTVAVANPAEDLGEYDLDDYLDPTGAKSVRAAVETDDTLGGVAHFARVAGVQDYDDIEIGGVPYIGAVFLVEVTAT